MGVNFGIYSLLVKLEILVMNELENTELCKKCGGRCCKKSGCDYYVQDFENFKFKYLEQRLKEGNISIVAALSFRKLRDGQLICEPFLYLRTRNVGRDVVDLFSMKTTCSSLTETGCIYDFKDRPSGGKHLVPMVDENGLLCCHSDVDMVEKILEYSPYQNVLSKLVKRFTGRTVDKQLSLDVIIVLYNLMAKKFDGVMEEEIEDLKKCCRELIQAFPKEAFIAEEIFEQENKDNILIYNKKEFK